MSPLNRRHFLKLTAFTAAAAFTATHTPIARADSAAPANAQAWFSAPKGSQKIALTYDDGYVNIARLLDAAKALDVRLTLFPIGKVIAAKPELWARAVAEGHEIGCHTYSHPALAGQPYDLIASELDQFLSIARGLLGLQQVKYFRPPYGSGWSDPNVQQAARDFGMQVVMWNRVNTMKSLSTDPRPSHVLQAFQTDARAGDIVLYHAYWQEVAAFKKIVAHARAQGWQPCTVGELLA